MKRTEHSVAPEAAGMDLVRFLAQAGGVSGRAAKRLLDERRVFVNGRRVWMARHALRAGDRVEVQGQAGPPARAEALRVLFEDAHYLVLDKPAGILSNGPGSLEARLRTARGAPGWTAAHRLDRDTTGCLLFAADRAARERVVALFRRRAVQKTYEAIVVGRVPAGLRRIDRPLEGRPALTEVDVLAATATASHLRLRIETGRTHQIRKHLLAEGYPLAGDKAYGTARVLPPAFRDVPRQLLHAAAIAFPHPLAEGEVSARAPLPPDFRAWLRRLGLG